MPYWRVRAGIAERAIIPEVRKDPTYLARERIRVFSTWGGTEIDPATVNWHAPQANRYVFRQDPGPQNALGLVRIDMPNQFTVYMHDTPLSFSKAVRVHSVSAACGCRTSMRLLGCCKVRKGTPCKGDLGTTLKVTTPVQCASFI
jgi:murein L,D-transpeptidase YcbB/YkuD